MPWSGSSFSRNTGVYTGATAWAQTDAAARGIRSDDHDTHDQDLADGINACLKKDGNNSPSANIPMNSFKLTGLAAGSSAGDSVRYEQLESGVLTTRGDMMYRNASAPARLAKGAEGTTLQMGANDPAWVAPATAFNTLADATATTAFTIAAADDVLLQDDTDGVWKRKDANDVISELLDLLSNFAGSPSMGSGDTEGVYTFLAQRVSDGVVGFVDLRR